MRHNIPFTKNGMRLLTRGEWRKFGMKPKKNAVSTKYQRGLYSRYAYTIDQCEPMGKEIVRRAYFSILSNPDIQDAWFHHHLSRLNFIAREWVKAMEAESIQEPIIETMPKR